MLMTYIPTAVHWIECFDQYIPPNKSKGGSKRADWSLL